MKRFAKKYIMNEKTCWRGVSARREDEGLSRVLWLALVALLLTGCTAKAPENGVGTRVWLDGAAWDGRPVSPEAGGARVYITLDGAALIDVPFAEPRTVTVQQPDGSENAVTLTGEAVYMDHANCDNQDCVNMGAVTLDNLEMRVMGGFIVCLPHRVSVEVRE